MFEGIIKGLILSFFGDYIENLDKDKLSVAVTTGRVTLKDIKLKAKTINDMKLPFRVLLGKIGLLDMVLPVWSNFSKPTVVTIENIQIVLTLIPQEDWEFIDFFSAEAKLNYLTKFFNNKIEELTEAFESDGKTEGYVNRTVLKILDNLHVNFKNLHIRIEDKTRKPFYSLGVTLEEMIVINTNEEWKEMFIDRNKTKDINVFKLLKIKNFGFYLKTNETYMVSLEESDNVLAKFNNIKSFEYLIKPISLTAKMRQNNSGREQTIFEEKDDSSAKIHVWINLENFDIDFEKTQFDTIIRIMNHVSNYQRFQYFHYDSRKFFYYKPDVSVKESPKLWWKYSIRTVIKRMKQLQGNDLEFAVNSMILPSYKEKFHKYYRVYINDPNGLSEDERKDFNRILTIMDTNILYEWAIENIKEHFTASKREKNKKANTGFLNMFSKKIKEEDLLTPEEIVKINEIIEETKAEIRNKVVNSQEIKLKVEFSLNNGSFIFTKHKNNRVEAFSFKYKDICFILQKSDVFTHIEAYLLSFDVEMITSHGKQNSKINQITYSGSSIDKYIWRLNLWQFAPGNPINSKLQLQINTIDVVYHQAFLERVISFFNVETQINEDIVNKAWDKWSELKEKTSEQLKIALEKKNIIEIDIQPRKLIIPLSKYDFKSSKLLVLQLGNISMNNFKGDENYDEKYKLDFASTGISFYNSLDELYGNQAGIALVKNMKLKLLIGLLTNRSMNKVLPKLSINLDIENIEINVTETMYYTFHFIVDIMKPTKQTDYWNILEQSKQDIKKNTKVCNRLLKKNNRYLYYDDYFAVLSGGYIYFYKNVDDDEYMEYFYIKDSVVTDKSIENIHEMHISNKYGNIDLQFTNEGKMKQWIKAITERVNEMKINWEEKDLITASTQAVAQLDKNEKDEPIDNIYDIIDVGVEINVRNICANLLDESKEMQKLFTINLTDFYFLLFIREKDVTMHMSLHSLRIYDEKYKHDPSFYEMLNSVNDSEYKLFSINILIAEVDSPRFNKAGIDIELKIGYLYAVWQPNSIRRLLHYLAHNDILRDKIKDEALGKTAEEIEKEMKTYPAEDEINKIKCNVTKELYMELSLTLQKVNIIWVNPINNIYFMNVSLNESNLYVEMTLDHFNVSGTLGNTQLADLTNYPYTIKSQQEYLDTKSFTEILGFKDSSSLTFEYHSYAIFCPLCKNNYTSKAIVNFNSVRLNYIQEYFFRMFNYLFAEFLGALSADQSVKDYKKERNQIPQIKSDEMEFLDLTCTFNNPQVLLKARNCFEEGFLADLGTVIITNSYTKKSGKIRNNPEIEKFISIYHFDLKELYIITHDKFKIVENTNAKVEMLFTALSEEENNMSDSLVDKSFVMNLWIDKIATNLRQNDFTYIMKCNDLNFLYIDGLDQQYNFTKNIEVAPSDEILIKDYNYMRVFLEIPNISLRLYEGTIFTEMILSEKTLTFEKKLNGMKEIDIVIRRCNIFNYLGVTGKEIMLTYYEDTENQNQFDIRMIIDSDGEKNMMIKIYNVKLTLRLDILQLIKTFFTEGFPIYDEHSKDLPNLFDPNEDNYPGMRVNLVLKKPVVSVLTDIMQNYDQDVICLTSDISMLYKKEKIINAKKELISNFRILNKELENTRDRNLLEKDIANDFKDTYVMNISLYEICCFVCTLNDIITSNLNIISKRKITNTFVFSYENKTLIHYYHPDTFIQSFRSLMEIKKITMKLSYRDIVLVLKAIEYNNSLMGIEYEGRMNKLTPKKPPIKIENTVVQSNTRDAGTGLYTVLSNGIQIVIIINIDSH